MFVLYTPDDIGGLRGSDGLPRARQNVVFEHGYLIAQLGRERVCALVAGDVEFPSDISGILYERFNNIDSEAIRIARVLKFAGYQVDPGGLL